jgi:hypothetical protein
MSYSCGRYKSDKNSQNAGQLFKRQNTKHAKHLTVTVMCKTEDEVEHIQ